MKITIEISTGKFNEVVRQYGILHGYSKEYATKLLTGIVKSSAENYINYTVLK